MADTISRQAAIDAAGRADYIGLDVEDVKSVIREVVKEIKKVPSAQPEIIRCKDCKYGSPNGWYGCKVYHYKKYETHDMKPDDFCSHAERRTNERFNQQRGSN